MVFAFRFHKQKESLDFTWRCRVSGCDKRSFLQHCLTVPEACY